MIDETTRRAMDMAATLGQYLSDLEPGELDMFTAQLVDDYPDEVEQLVTELTFWSSDDDTAIVVGIGYDYDYNNS